MDNKGIIFISGSSSGIGFNLAKKFSQLGYKLILNGRNQNKLKLAAKKIKNCDYMIGDISNKRNIINIIKKINKKYKSIDFLISNVGDGSFKRNNKDYENAFNTNLFSSINLIENFCKILKKNKSKIICISSICGVERIEGAPIAYSIAKSALNFYVKMISKELAEYGITINAVVPGNILFEGSTWQKKLRQNPKKTRNYIKKLVPSNSFGSTDDIFALCKLIIENDSKFMTGSLLRLDGGQTNSS